MARPHILAAALGVVGQNLHYYYVRADFAASPVMAQRLSSLRYQWFGYGLATNYAFLLPRSTATQSGLRRTITTLADHSSRYSGRDHIVAKRMGDDRTGGDDGVAT